jgi:hypothetical protein
LRHSHIADEVRRVSSQNARDYAIAEAEIRHQQVAQACPRRPPSMPRT